MSGCSVSSAVFQFVFWGRDFRTTTGGHTHTHKQRNEEAEMGDGWRILGGGLIVAGDGGRIGAAGARPTPSTGFESWAETVSAQTD